MIRNLIENVVVRHKLNKAEKKGNGLLSSLMGDLDEQHPFVKYENALAVKRDEVSTRLKKVISEKNPEVFLRLVIFYAAGGYHITKPVDRWIRTAGEACIHQGYKKLGEKLVRHAEHEAGHESMHAEDLNLVVDFYNKEFGQNLNAKDLLNTPFTEGIKNYISLHEETISGAQPFVQIAIEYEIERLSISAGPVFLKTCFERFGLELLRNLKFITEHARLDAGHTIYNRDLICEFLGKSPSTLDAITLGGQKALEYFAQYVEDAYRLAARV
ncbi:MAG: hypothetical protein AB7F43_09165 [Bacteriovoracia bacterium]